ncbi:MAG: hypothetical protein Q9187_004213 [Circinaria calcarea]
MSTDNLFKPTWLASHPVYLRVGTSSFTVHQALLLEKAGSYFKPALTNPRFIEEETQTIDLSPDNPEAFQHVLNWIYYDTLALPKQNLGDIQLQTLAEIWVWADYLLIRELQDSIVLLVHEYLLCARSMDNSISLEEMSKGWKIVKYNDRFLQVFLEYLNTLPADEMVAVLQNMDSETQVLKTHFAVRWFERTKYYMFK